MKKIYISVLLVVTCVFCFGVFNAEASPSDAKIRGYTISDNWNYVSDVTNDFQEVHGQTYYEGKMSSWMGVYKYLDQTTNDLFVLVMCTTMMEPNQNSYWDQKRWNNQEMRVEFYPEITDTSIVDLVNYGPESSEGTLSWSSLELCGVDLSLFTTQTYLYPEIKVSPKTLSNQDNGVEIIHSFERYKTNTDINNVCCNLVTKKHFAIFKVSDFNKYEHYTFHIDFYATFYRYGVINTASVTGEQTYKFTIGDHKHAYDSYFPNRDGISHTASCICGKSVVQPCLGFADLEGIARCAKCNRLMKKTI